MKRIVLSFAIFLLASFCFGVGNNSNINLSLNLGECVFATRLLNSVDVKGSEVDVYLTTKDFFMSTIEKNKSKKAQNEIKLVMPLEVAQGFITFTQEATIPGGDAKFYQGIIKKIIDAAK